MADVFHVNADLVCAACFKLALNNGNITKPFKYFKMGSRILAILAIGVGVENFAKALMAADMGLYRSGVFGNIALNKRNVLAVDGMVEKLLCQAGYRFFGFGQHH